MGDVLSFYYGKFYRSDAQRRWVECRKTKSRKCILGHRIFTGWRQQELLSRLLSSRSKEVQETLIEVTKAFTDGTASLEEFIFSLKAIVGAEALVHAVGIGKGKQDLTGIVLDHVRPNPAVSARPEIPVGKDCSSLTSAEIVKFLTGDFRLSKAKANDLFWEAVWPRLLARGWHSEQPKDLSALTSKNALVFLIPGIKKFSRKKLTKGNHYFDSVSDVLNKVASDPRLLELEAEEGKESNGVNESAADTKVVQNVRSDRQQSCYLRPRLPDNCHSDFMKFTVVDTSLAQGGASSKVRELRSLPADATFNYRSSHQGVTNSDSSTDQSSSGDSFINSSGESDQTPLVADSKLKLPKNEHGLEGQSCELFIDKSSIKGKKYQFSRKLKSGEQNSSAPGPKRRRLTSCKSAGACSSSSYVPRHNQLNNEEEHIQLESVESNKSTATEDGTSQGESNGAGPSNGKSQQRAFIDLNLDPQDLDSEGPLDMGVEGNEDELKPEETIEPKQETQDPLANEANVINGQRHSEDDLKPNETFEEKQYTGDPLASEANAVHGQQNETFEAKQETEDTQASEANAINCRRHGTRNRPPTTRALEAVACGFLSVRKEKSSKPSRSGNLTSRSSRRARKNLGAHPNPSPSSSTSTSSRVPSVGIEEGYSQTTNLFDNSRVKTERKESHELLGVLY
ncbi:uncharacterized protein A4U43_C02F21080 [Asparagus officinalis]|uniref:SANT domain-containing protein n=2 Tax=Asparagus officinalis TaxID=4686 RepID=A0A5P1FK19_ASPOF|nr:uncharacterized protein A4U43_C02F21080 [Asparagus officinalis]